MDSRLSQLWPFRLDHRADRHGGGARWCRCTSWCAALEGLAVQPVAILNIAIEVALVAAPIIFYARDVIAQLKNSRTSMDEMSRRLAITAEQADQANRAKSAFLANMSHELRTPLNAIMGFSEVMKDQHLGPVQNPRYLAYAGDIHASGRYLLGIINDILDLSKIEAGKMSLDQAEEFPLRQALEGSLAICATLGEKFGVRLELRTAAGKSAADGGGAHDPPDHDQPGGQCHQVHARRRLCRSGGRGAALTAAMPSRCSDSGIGMSKSDIVKALTPFGQVENKMTATHNGTGLGPAAGQGDAGAAWRCARDRKRARPRHRGRAEIPGQPHALRPQGRAA